MSILKTNDLKKYYGIEPNLVKVLDGSVEIDGKELSKMNDDQLTIFRRRNIGFIFQNYSLVPILNVYENIVLSIELDGEKPDKEFVDTIVRMLGLTEKLDNLPNNISGGQQQRVA